MTELLTAAMVAAFAAVWLMLLDDVSRLLEVWRDR